MPVVLGAPAAVGVGVAVGVGIGAAAKGIYQKLIVRRLISTRTPAIYMEVGDSEELGLQLLTKPRWSKKFVNASGRITLSGGGSVFDIDGGSRVTKNGNPLISVVVNALSVGTGTIRVIGVATDGSRHDDLLIPVQVVGPEGSLLALYAGAAGLAQNVWFNSAFGNALINIGKLGRKGLCNHWAAWTLEWVVAHNHCRAVEVAYVSWSGLLPHNACKVTLSDGRVFYFDPWDFDDPPYRPQDEVEDSRGVPDKDYTIWRKEEATNDDSSTVEDDDG